MSCARCMKGEATHEVRVMKLGTTPRDAARLLVCDGCAFGTTRYATGRLI